LTADGCQEHQGKLRKKAGGERTAEQRRRHRSPLEFSSVGMEFTSASFIPKCFADIFWRMVDGQTLVFDISRKDLIEQSANK
jgi:hypothetical protein